MRFFLDTSICIDVLRTAGPESSVELFKTLEESNVGHISSITVAELFAGVHLSKRRNAAEKTEDLLSFLEIIDFTSEIAREGGKIYAQLTKLGQKIEFNDCLIASTAQYAGYHSIVTRNIDHFARIDGLTAITPEDIIR
ncbi:MAG: type II toxin-antitoxin system VapC family toxin [Methanomicrobiales archaeon]|nr:type II toxin-antitoxin system VapC family toxin [Methanomicrobiales archaeon]